MSKARFFVTLILLEGLVQMSLVVASVQAEIRTVRALNVYDSNGVRLGKVLDIAEDGRVTVGLATGGFRFVIIVGNGQPFFWGNAGGLVFLLPDCAGQAYMDIRRVDTGPVPPSIVFGANNTVWVGDNRVPILNADFVSRMEQDGSCVPDGYRHNAVPAFPAGDLRPMFTPPFTVR